MDLHRELAEAEARPCLFCFPSGPMSDSDPISDSHSGEWPFSDDLANIRCGERECLALWLLMPLVCRLNSWKTGSTSRGHPVMLPTAGWPIKTLSHGSSRPSCWRTMLPRMVAQDCADTSRDRARNVGKSWAIQDLIHLLKACAAARYPLG